MLSKLIFSFILCLFNANLNLAKFNNQVVYPDLNKEVYSFELVFREGLSMSINKPYNDFDPVYFNISDGKFYARDKNLFHECDIGTLVTDQEKIDSITTVDGRHRSMILVNDQFPGPPIVVPKGAKVEIKVHNKMRGDVLSVHWHGMTQKGSFQMDGVTKITQCPIAPGEYFVYKFVANDAGTHWYHSHSSVQRTDGALGSFIVIDTDKISNLNNTNNNTNNNSSNSLYEKEFYFFVQDWQYMQSEEKVNLALWGSSKFWDGFELNKNQCFYPFRIEDASMMMIKPDSFIINGKGWHIVPDKIDDLNSFISDAKKLPLEKFSVKPNKRYLFRVIGANMGFPIVISVNGHKINLVATDGNDMNAINLDYLIINGGERYDFEVVTKEENNKDYFIIIQGLASFNYNFSKLNKDYFGVAILNYEGSNNNLVYEPVSCKPCLISNCPYLLKSSSNLKCVNSFEMKSKENKISAFDKEKLFKTNYTKDEFEEYFFNFHFAGDPILRSAINGKQYSLPRFPPFFQNKFESSIEGMECPSECSGEKTCHCSSRTKITPGKTIQFVFYNMGRGAGVHGTAHPAHLHGHHFYVVSVGYPEYYENGTFFRNNANLKCKSDDTEYCNAISWSSSQFENGNVPNANLVNPIKKDTVIVPVGGYVVVRFFSDNIGYWFLHCHIEVHATDGMATLIQEGTDEQIRERVNWTDMHTCFKGYVKSDKINPITIVSTSSKLLINYFMLTSFLILSRNFN